MNLLFITRKYPPKKGGMEKFSYNFYIYISKLTNAKLIRLNGSQIFLPFFFIYSFIKTILIKRDKIDIIHLGDALLSPLGVLLKITKKIPVTVTVHALDIIFPNKLYQFIIPMCLKRLDMIICVSQETMKECIKRGIAREKCVVIPNGVEIFYPVEKIDKRKVLLNLIHNNINNKKIILSVGRLIERKGMHYFIQSIFPSIIDRYPDVIYIIAGSGKLKNKIKLLIEKLGLKNDIYLLENVDDLLLSFLYQVSDIFVMPNVPVEGDMEGFGIVALEASSAGLPVVCSNIEGLKDAIIDKQNGFLISPYDAEKYIDVILELLKNDMMRKSIGQKGRDFTMTSYNWEKISRKYEDVFSLTIKNYDR
jgi:glycosyltransferase involved in cell wall biosynthesis